jgi:hypothetical protein
MIVSFYTENWRYRERAEAMADQLKMWGIAHDIRPLADRGNWLANTRLKPFYIREMLDLYPRIVWVDADSLLHQRPGMLLDFREDLLLRPHSTVEGRAWHVAVMGWKSTPQTRALCNEWIQCAESDGGTDEAAFDKVISRYPSLSIGLMPPKYHRLHHEPQSHAVISIGISQDDDKMRIKKRHGFT